MLIARPATLGVVAVLALAFALVPLGVRTAAADSEPTVTQAVQVTANPDPVRGHSAPQIARNPVSGELVLVESDPRGGNDGRACNVHRSADEGRTWTPGGSPMRAPYTDCSIHAEYGPYAALAFGRDGVLYVAYVASDPRFANPIAAGSPTVANVGRAGCVAPGPTVALVTWAPDPACGPQTRPVSHPPRRTPRHVFLARSEDGGRTFAATAVFKGPEEAVDAPERLPQEGINKGPMLAVDPTDSDNVYVGWRQGDLREDRGKLASLVAASTDGGRTFADPVDLSDDRGGDFPALAVDGDGTVHAVYWARTAGAAEDEAPVRPILYLRSTDNGATFGDRVVIDDGNQDAERPPLIVADPASGALYVAWNAPPDPMNAAADYDGDNDVFLLASPDAGRSWGSRVLVNDDGDSGTDQVLPGIAVTDGRIDIAWYDDRPSGRPDPGYQNVFYASSTDGGASFSPNVRVNDRAIDRTVGVWGNNILSRHNVGLASGADGAYVAWQDTRNASPEEQAEDVYMATVEHRPGRSTAAAGSARLLWAGLGLGAGLLLAGLVLILALRTRAGKAAPA